MLNRGALNQAALNASASDEYIQAEVSWDGVSAAPSLVTTAFRIVGAGASGNGFAAGGIVTSIPSYKSIHHQASLNNPNYKGDFGGAATPIRGAVTGWSGISPPTAATPSNTVFTTSPVRPATVTWLFSGGYTGGVNPELGTTDWEAGSVTPTFGATKTYQAGTGNLWYTNSISPDYAATHIEAVTAAWDGTSFSPQLYCGATLTKSLLVMEDTSAPYWAGGVSTSLLASNGKIGRASWGIKITCVVDGPRKQYVDTSNIVQYAGIFLTSSTVASYLAVSPAKIVAANAAIKSENNVFQATPTHTASGGLVTHNEGMLWNGVSSSVISAVYESKPTVVISAGSIFGCTNFTYKPGYILVHVGIIDWNTPVAPPVFTSETLRVSSAEWAAKENNIFAGATNTKTPIVVHDVGLPLSYTGSFEVPALTFNLPIIMDFIAELSISAILVRDVKATLLASTSITSLGVNNLISEANTWSADGVLEIGAPKISLTLPIAATGIISKLNRDNVTAERFSSMSLEAIAEVLSNSPAYVIRGGTTDLPCEVTTEITAVVMVPATTDWVASNVPEITSTITHLATTDWDGLGVEVNIAALLSRQPAGAGRQFALTFNARIFYVRT